MVDLPDTLAVVKLSSDDELIEAVEGDLEEGLEEDLEEDPSWGSIRLIMMSMMQSREHQTSVLTRARSLRTSLIHITIHLGILRLV